LLSHSFGGLPQAVVFFQKRKFMSNVAHNMPKTNACVNDQANPLLTLSNDTRTVLSEGQLMLCIRHAKSNLKVVVSIFKILILHERFSIPAQVATVCTLREIPFSSSNTIKTWHSYIRSSNAKRYRAQGCAAHFPPDLAGHWHMKPGYFL